MNDFFKEQWIDTMTRSLILLNPCRNVEDIKAFVNDQFGTYFTDHECVIYNSYENTVTSTTLNSTLNWIQSYKPLIAESGVFFFPKDKKRNVNTEIIKEQMLDKRTIDKAKMFEYLEKGDTFNAAVKNIQQANDKKAANSGYGAEGESSSFLYNIHSAMSVTSCGRGQISTACQCFDNLLADYVKFFNMNEFFTYINHILSEEKSWNFKTFDVIDEVPSKSKFVHRFETKFLHHSLMDVSMIETLYESLTKEQRIRIYYKANLREFLMCRKVSDIYTNIGISSCDFVDPNKIPKEIEAEVSLLCELVTEFVNYKFSVYQYEDRTKYQKRSVIVVIDTDSNMIYYGSLLKFVLSKVMPMRLFKNKAEYEVYRLKILNVLSCFSSYAIKETLGNYLGYVNVSEEDKKHIKMKNEFYYERMIITFAKKSYIGLQKRKESHVFKNPELDVKGVNFFKSTAAAKTSEFIYKNILMDQLLRPEDGKISLKRTYHAIYKFQKDIAEDIAKGDMGFLKRSIRVKSPDAYANPLGIGQYKAVYVWNKVNDDKDRIDLPATVTIVKVQLRNKQDVAKLEKWPKIFNRMMKLFEEDPEIGDYIKKDDDKAIKVKGKGIKAIALPNDYEEVPEWLLSIIDVETLVSDNMKLFTQLYRPLGLSKGSASHNGSSVDYYTNIVRI